MGGLRFAVLGPLEVWDGPRRVRLAGRQQPVVLAALLLNANRVVAVDRLVECLWAGAPPAAARRLVHGCVAELRRALRRADSGGVGTPILTRSPGYLIEVEPGQLDLDRFTALAAAGRRALQRSAPAEGAAPADELAQASRLFAEAIGLWRGPVLHGLVLDGLAGAVAGLDEDRMTVLEDRIEVDLQLGRHALLVGELQAQVRAHPLRERLWAQLMLTLAGADRQADALAAYRQVRIVLVDQLGIEPGPLLQAVERTILAGADPLPAYLETRPHPDPETGSPGPGPRAVPAPDAAADLAQEAPGGPRAGAGAAGWRPVPAQLPPDVAGFTGRSAELAALTELLTIAHPPERPAAAVVISAVSGTAGVGKPNPGK